MAPYGIKNRILGAYGEFFKICVSNDITALGAFHLQSQDRSADIRVSDPDLD
jgi:hypothetical protein